MKPPSSEIRDAAETRSCVRPPPTIRRGAIPLCFTVLVLAIFFLALLIFPTAPSGSQIKLVAELVRESHYVGSFDQRSAHLVALVAVVALSTAGFFGVRRGVVRSFGRDPAPRLDMLACLLVTLLGLLVYRELVAYWLISAGLVLAIFFFAFVLAAPFLHRRTVETAAILAIGTYLAVVIVPGLLTDPVPWPVSDANSIAQIELHLLALVQPGSAIAAGQRFFAELPFNYGLLVPSLISVIDHRLGPLTVGDQVRFVQICQVLFTIAAAAAYLCYRPRSYLGVLVALLLAAPYWSSAGLGIWHPNQTGMRSLTFPLGILALTAAGRFRPNDAAWGLGAIGAIALLINFETTVAVAFGFLVYLVLRTRSVPLVAIMRMSIAAILVTISYFILYRLALGRLPFGRDFSHIFQTLSQITTGNIGLRLFSAGDYKENYYIVPLAFVMFAHAAYVVLAAFWRLGQQPLSHLSALRAAIAIILIVWLSYYFNMPNWWQIWTHLFLYGFLLIELFDLRLFAVGAARRTPAWPPFWQRSILSRAGRVVPIFLLAIVIPHTNQHLLQFTQNFMSPYWMRNDHDASVVSDLFLPRAAADAIKEKTAKLLAMNAADPGRVLYLTYNVTFVPMLSRLFEPAPERSLWGSIEGDVAFDPAINKLLAKRPKLILIDAPTGPLAVTGTRKDFQERVRHAVSRDYELAETESGWQIWRPRAPK
jgi:hypothetical protein